MSEKEESTIACNLGAIAADERTDHAERAESIFHAALEIKELSDGYAFRLPLDNAMLQKSMDWLLNERLCCPFFRFRLDIGEVFWLELCGTPDVKAYVGELLVKPLQEEGKLPDKEAFIAAHR